MATVKPKAEYITKKHKRKDKTIVEIEYRIDANFEPKEISEISMEFINNYLVAHDTEEGVAEWAADVFSRTEVIKNGKRKGQEQAISFPSIRMEFAKKFFPSIIKGDSSKSKESLRDTILKRYKKQ